ncbi:unnamed protein product [Orchesella dallaii]|uniref:Lipase domain-containing protein n=1 Tax=Orchesella dallaii TaxID=48710 RepID=A0ABP1QI54_9HEXA
MNKNVNIYGTSILCIVVVNLFQLCLSTELSRDPNDVHFFLYPDPRNPNVSEEIVFNDTESLQNSSFNPQLTRTVFITHGFRSNVSSMMPQMVKNAFLASTLQYNIIIVSWGALSTPLPAELTSSLYTLVIANVPIVGRRLAEFIIFMKDQNAFNIENLYLIGHSLGSHVSGLAGMNIKEWTDQQIPRITGE